MRPIRLAFVLPSMAGGGAERVALEVLKGLPACDYRLTLGLLERKGPYLSSVPSHVQIVEIGGAATLSSFPKTAPKLERFWHRVEPDLLLGFLTELNISLLLWLLAHPKRRERLLISEHNNILAKLEQDSNPLRRRTKLSIQQWLYPKAAEVIAVSDGIASILRNSCKVPKKRLSVIHNPVALDEVRLGASEPPALDLRGSERFTVVAAGRLVPQKGFDVLLHAFAAFSRTRPSRLIVLGEGPLEHELRELVRNLNLEGEVIMPGFLDNPWAVFARSDVFVLSSLWEGFGNVIIEAMACGVAIIATDCPHGPKEILADGRYGALVPVGDVAKLSQALEHLADDPGERHRLAVLGQRRAAMFGSSLIIKQYHHLFQKHARQGSANR